MMLNPFSISGLVLSITCFILLFIIIKSATTLVHYIWALFNISVAIWGIGSFFLMMRWDFFLILFWLRVAHAGVILISVFFFHLVYLICDLKNKKVLATCYLQGFVFFILNFTDYFVKPKNIELMYGTFYFDRSHDLLIFLFFCIWLGFILYGHYELLRTYSKSTGFKKNQILYFFVGTLVGFSGGITNFFPTFGIPFYPIGNFTIPLYCIIITYAILKYRILDIKIAITRTGLFIILYTLILGLPFVAAAKFRNYFYNILHENWWILPQGLMAVLATIGPFIYLYLDKKAQDKLLKEQRSYQNILRSASSGMIRVKDLKRLLNLIVHVVTKTVKIQHASIYLLDQENNRYVLQALRGRNDAGDKDNFIDAGTPLIWQLISQRTTIVTEEAIMKLRDEPQSHGLSKFVEQLINLKAALAVPSFVDDKLIGILILGEKFSGKLFSSDDINVFSVLANQAALAIENAQFYDEVRRTHEQLFQAEKLATIGTMADGLSHQINNRFHALSLIAGDSLDMLKMFDWSSCNDDTKKIFIDLKDALERIENNVLQGGEVVKGLLKYSRPGEGGFEFIDFKDVLNGAIDMVQYKIKLKEIDLVQNLTFDVPKIHGNLTQLQEVFFNMIDNAYDAIKERQIVLKEEGYRGKIEISAFGRGGSLEITVSDNGMGVKDQDKKKLFTPFFTTKATAKKGTGLGLYVIEKIITSHKGKLNMDSVYQSGTRFTITLPISAK